MSQRPVDFGAKPTFLGQRSAVCQLRTPGIVKQLPRKNRARNPDLRLAKPEHPDSEWHGYQVNYAPENTMRIYASIAAMVLTTGLLGVLIGQSNRKSAPEPKFSELSNEDNARLEQQRAVIAAAAKQRYGLAHLDRTKSDLPVLQHLINDKVFNKTQTYELQCLGVAFGDVLTSELPLRWVMITDEFGTDPTLRFKETTLQINALTMISKRVERGEPVNVQWLLDETHKQLVVNEKKFR
jgi:hypothetical protein